MFSAENKVALLGKGRYAVVECFRQSEGNNHHYVAVKKFHDPAQGTECKVLQKLSGHNNIVQLISTVETPQDERFLVIEALLGGSLNKHIHQGTGELQISSVQRLTSELLSALSALEKHGCIHRDIKTSNCVLDHTGRLKLCDFGSATMGAFCLPKPQHHMSVPDNAETENKKSNQHRALTITGTAHIMAPEMVAGDIGYDYSVDYWGLGVMLYELLTGHIPQWRRLPSEDTRQGDCDATHMAVWPDDHAKHIARLALFTRCEVSVPIPAVVTADTIDSAHPQHAEPTDIALPPATQSTTKELEQVSNSWHIAVVDPDFSTSANVDSSDLTEQIRGGEFAISKTPEEVALRNSAIDLVHLLLTIDPYTRYSTLAARSEAHTTGSSEGLWSELIRFHPFFAAVDWERVDNGTAPPAYPDFDRRVGCMELLEEFSGANDVISEAEQDLFAGF